MSETEEAPQVGGIAADRLRSIIDRVERLEEERKSLGNDIKTCSWKPSRLGLM